MKSNNINLLNSFLLSIGISLVSYSAHAGFGVKSATQAANPNISPAAGISIRAHYVIRGNYAAAGVSMRNLGYGNIDIAGIPANSKVVRAFLYWDILNSGQDPLLSMGNFNGNPIRGALVGQGGDPCWIGGGNFAYRADVTSLVTGNGTYSLTGFASGDTSGAFPWSSDPVFPLAEGATLVVIYANQSLPALDMVLVEGSDMMSSAYSLTVNGFLAAKPGKRGQATYTSFGADGQANAPGEQIYFNGNLISTSDWDGADGPNQLWDTHTHDVSAYIKEGDTSATISYPGNASDCLVWVGAIVAVPASDADGDGLMDVWEKNGYTDPISGKSVDLPGMGAAVKHKDAFIEIDYMEAGDHTHKPLNKAVKKVVAAFKSAPVPNPDGKTGITLHVDYGQGGLYTGGNSLTHEDILPGVINDDWTSFDAIKDANLAAERKPIFHYCLFAHDISPQGTSGISRGIPGSDFVVSLGSWTNHVGTTQEQAGTLMHEFGHNINLHHGGDDDTNYKPNFLSIMNYFFQTRGLHKSGKDGNFDYSRHLMPALEETGLDESDGLDGEAATDVYGTRYFCPNGSEKSVNLANSPIDWNCNGDATEDLLAADINADGSQTTLMGFNDWDNLDFRGGSIGSPVGVAPSTVKSPAVLAELSHELTVAEDRKIKPSAPANAKRRNGTVEWTPVGLEIIAAYKIYLVGSDSQRSLVTTIPSNAETEDLDRVSASLPKGAGGRFVITSVDIHGNESAPAPIK